MSTGERARIDERFAPCRRAIIPRVRVVANAFEFRLEYFENVSFKGFYASSDITIFQWFKDTFYFFITLPCKLVRGFATPRTPDQRGVVTGVFTRCNCASPRNLEMYGGDGYPRVAGLGHEHRQRTPALCSWCIACRYKCNPTLCSMSNFSAM